MEAVLLGRGEERVLRVSGIAVNRAREAYDVGGVGQQLGERLVVRAL